MGEITHLQEARFDSHHVVPNEHGNRQDIPRQGRLPESREMLSHMMPSPCVLAEFFKKAGTPKRPEAPSPHSQYFGLSASTIRPLTLRQNP